jgi:hypothetical protein
MFYCRFYVLYAVQFCKNQGLPPRYFDYIHVFDQGTLAEGEGLVRTVDLLVKVACFCNKNYVFIIKRS